MACLRESPAPWKKQYERAKSAIKMLTRDMTTAEVVDSPTPLAPPMVVTPQEQLTTAMIAPNTCDLIMALTMSQGLRARCAESRMMLALIPYIPSASSALEASPTVKQSKVRTGRAMQQAITLGVTR